MDRKFFKWNDIVKLGGGPTTMKLCKTVEKKQKTPTEDLFMQKSELATTGLLLDELKKFFLCRYFEITHQARTVVFAPQWREV